MKTPIGVKEAYRQGFAAGQSGMGTDSCCWLTDTPRGIAWFAGWKDGRNAKADRKDAAIMRSAQRLNYARALCQYGGTEQDAIQIR